MRLCLVRDGLLQQVDLMPPVTFAKANFFSKDSKSKSSQEIYSTDYIIFQIFLESFTAGKIRGKNETFVMVDLNKGINIIKHNFLKCFCNFGHSGTVLHAICGSSSAHARNMPANMCDPKNNNFNTQHSINIFYFIVIIVKKYAKKWYQLFY